MMKKRILSIILVVSLIIGFMPLLSVSVKSAGITLEQLQKKYPHEKYWNGGNANGYTSTPCTHHGNCSKNDTDYSGWCGCNSYKGKAIQCHGFAYQLASLIYGGDPYSDWTADRNLSALNNLKSGDIVRYKNGGHSIFVISVNGETVTYADCNSDDHCKIRWNQIISKTTLKSSFTYVDPAPYEWIKSGSHVHLYTGSHIEAAHPHRVYQKCSCGKTQYVEGKTGVYQNCSTCMKLSWAYVQPVKAYTINTGKTVVYSSVGGTAKSNKIYDTDLCTISEVYDCGWCKVSFPLDAGGTDTGYVKIGVFMKSGGFISYASSKLTTYSRSDLKTSIGNTASGDKIYILGNTSTAVQIAYPLSAGGYKVGWIPISSYKGTFAMNANGGSGSMSNFTVKYGDSFTIPNNKFTYTGHNFGGWNVYRTSDKKWFVPGGWKTEKEITSNNLQKMIYKNGWSGKFDKSWKDYSKTSENYTLYPIWNKNVLSVYINANGGTVDSDTYKLTNNIVYKKEDNSKYVQKWTYNSKKTNGLVNASTLGLSKKGHKFSGWGTSANGGTIFDQKDADLVPTSIKAGIKTGNCSTTLYAIWKPDTYTVKYDANAKEVSNMPSNQTKTYGKNLTLSNKIPERDGYEFEGWATKNTATKADYKASGVYSNNKGITLYAVWKCTEGVSANYKYRILNNKDVEIYEYIGSETDVIIPSDLEGYNVTKIGDKCFYNNSNIRFVMIRDNITTIGSEAFYGCSSLEQVIIGESVVEAEDNAFSNCASTLTINVPKDSYIEKYASELNINITYKHEPELEEAIHYCEWDSEYTIDKEATCTEEGYKSIHCLSESCNKIKDGVVIEKEAHVYERVTTKAATCESHGETVNQCILCGLQTEKTEIPQLDHDFGEWYEVEDSSGTNSVVEERKCNNCNITERKDIDYIPSVDENMPRIYMDNVNASAGEQVTMCVSMVNNPGITSLRMKIEYDESVMTMTDFEFGTIVSDLNKNTSENYKSGYSFSMYSGVSDFKENGVLAKVTFKINENLEDGSYPIALIYDQDDIFDVDGNNVEFNFEVGTILLGTYKQGDLNQDGKINMKDIVLLHQLVNGWEVTYNVALADYNLDGKVNMKDVVALSRFINQ